MTVRVMMVVAVRPALQPASAWNRVLIVRPQLTAPRIPPCLKSASAPTSPLTANDPDNDPLTYSYTTSGGQITGSGANVQLETAGVAPGTYTVNCHVDDGRGEPRTAESMFTAQKPKEQIQLEAGFRCTVFISPPLSDDREPTGGWWLASKLHGCPGRRFQEISGIQAGTLA